MIGSSRTRGRSCDEALREELAEQTRERVLAAVARLLWERALAADLERVATEQTRRRSPRREERA